MSTPHILYLEQIHNIIYVKMNNEDESFIWIIHFSLTELNVCNDVMWFAWANWILSLQNHSILPSLFHFISVLSRTDWNTCLEVAIVTLTRPTRSDETVSSFPSKHDQKKVEESHVYDFFESRTLCIVNVQSIFVYDCTWRKWIMDVILVFPIENKQL